MRILLSILLALMLVPGWSGDSHLERLSDPGRIVATPVLLDAADPSVTRVGRLTFLGGMALTSPDPAFGGFSSLSVTGDRFTLLSDGGAVVRFRLGVDWRLREVHFASLPGGPATGWTKQDRDSESMAHDPASGRVWVGFEHYNVIWRYGPDLSSVERHVAPPDMARWNEGGGAESMVRRGDGRFVVLSETSHWPGRHDRAGLVFPGDPTTTAPAFRFAYRPPPHTDPSDAAELPDGSMVVINRRFRLPYDFSATLTIVPGDAVRAGAVVSGRPIATLAAPLLHDNFEGVAVTREADATILWLVSDDNQSRLQRSLLLKFRLDPGA